MKKKLLSILSLLVALSLQAQVPYASEVIILNGESYGQNKSNIASYNILTKDYTIIDSMLTSSVQSLLIEDSIAYLGAQTKIFAYNLNSKTKVAEANFNGVSPSKKGLFTDNNYIFVGNWHGQTDSNLYAYNKSDLSLAFAVTEATKECNGGTSYNDTLYIGQKVKNNSYADTLGKIVVANANDGTYYRTIDLDTMGVGIESIFHNGNFIYAVCPKASNILKIEIGTDAIQIFHIDSGFTQSIKQEGTKIYLNADNKASYFDMSTDALVYETLGLFGSIGWNPNAPSALAYDPITPMAFSAHSDFSSFGKMAIYTATENDTIDVGISPEALAVYYRTASAPIALNDVYEFIYNEDTTEYTLDVLANDTDPANHTLSISQVSTPQVSGANATIQNNKIVYTRASGIATTDEITYTVCNQFGACATATAEITLKSTTAINEINSNAISLFPNPADKHITIKGLENVELVEVFSINGNLVKVSKETTINLENLAKGLYFVRVKTSNTLFSKKFTIN